MTEPRFSGIFSVAMGSAASGELKAPVAIKAYQQVSRDTGIVVFLATAKLSCQGSATF